MKPNGPSHNRWVKSKLLKVASLPSKSAAEWLIAEFNCQNCSPHIFFKPWPRDGIEVPIGVKRIHNSGAVEMGFATRGHFSLGGERQNKAMNCDTGWWFIIRFWILREPLPGRGVISRIVAKIPRSTRNTEEPWMTYRFYFCRSESSARLSRKVWMTGYWPGTSYWGIGKPDRTIRGTIEERKKKRKKDIVYWLDWKLELKIGGDHQRKEKRHMIGLETPTEKLVGLLMTKNTIVPRLRPFQLSTWSAQPYRSTLNLTGRIRRWFPIVQLLP